MRTPTETSISETCNKVIEYYQRCMQKQDTYQLYKPIKTEYDRLKIWASSIGVYSRSPASADDRLRESDDLRVLVLELLASLSEYLQRYVSTDEQSSSTGSSTSSEDTSSSSEDGVPSSDTPNKYARLLNHVRRANSRLFSVLTLVRQPTHLTSNEKVFRFDFENQLGAATYKELIEEFEKYIEFYLNHTFASGDIQGTTSLSKSIFQKLKAGALLRRKSLILKERHKRKLRANVNTKFKVVPDRFKDMTGHQQMPGQLQVQPKPASVALSKPGSIELSATVPSVAAKPLPNRIESLPSQPAPKSSKSRILLRGKLDIPPPPRLEAFEQEANCYICGLTLDRGSFSGDRWSKHVLGDIDAFVCLFECDKPDVLYKTSEDWYEHMQTHRMQWVCMMPAHAHLTFGSKDELETHLRADHPSGLSHSQIERLSTRAQRPLYVLFEECPLCGQTAADIEATETAASHQPSLPTSENGKTTVRLLQRHIESHMFQLALLSILPSPETAALSESVAVNEDFKGLVNDSTGVRFREEGLASLPQSTDAQQQPEDFNVQLPIAIARGQVCPNFFVVESKDASEQWATFISHQKSPPDLDFGWDAWQTTCRQIQIVRDQRHDSDDQWHSANEALLADLNTSFQEKARSSAQVKLNFSVAEGLCSNLEIVRAIREVSDPTDIAIEPPDTDGERNVDIIFPSAEDTEVAVADFGEFQLCNVPIPVLMVDMKTTPAESAGVDEVIQPAEITLRQHVSMDMAIFEEAKSYAQAQHLPVEIRDWLQAPDPSADFAAARLTAATGSGDWFLETQCFRNWSLASNSFLWLHGFPRRGKSVLCARIIEYLLQMRQVGAGIATAFFFFERSDDIKHLRAFLAQLSAQIPELVQMLVSLQRNGHQEFPPDFVVLACLKQVIQNYRHVYIVLDGLDECPQEDQRDSIIRHLSVMRSWALPCLHILITSRTLSKIRDALPLRDEQEAFLLRGEDIDADRERFVIDRLQNSNKLKHLEKYHPMIQDYLVQHGKGSFQWVLHHLTTLQKVPARETDITEALDALPAIFGKTYDEILLKIPSRSQDIARQVLELVCFAERDLSLAEINEFLAIDVQHLQYDANRKVTTSSTILDICSGLVVAVRADDFNESDSSRERVMLTDNSIARLGDFTVGSYLLSEQIRSNPARKFALSTTDGHASMSMLCLIYLTREDLEGDGSSDDFTGQYTLMPYAARYWITHFKLARGAVTSEHVTQASKLCTSEELFKRWFRLHDELDEETPNSSNNTEPSVSSYYLALYGLDLVLEEVLRQCPDHVNASGGYYGSTLQAASFRGEKKIVKMLLEYGADVNASSGMFGSALVAASFAGSSQVVRMLLDAGADVNFQSEYHGSPAQAALNSHCEQTLYLLLDHGARLSEDKGQYGFDEMYYAVAHGEDRMIATLLRHQVEVDLVDEYLRTPLSWASEKGKLLVAELLVGHGAKVNSADESGCTPLIWASRSGHERVAQMLLKHGAQIDQRDGENGRTAISWAAWGGHEGLVRLLVEHGAQIDLVDSSGYSALGWAAKIGNEAIISLLLQRNAQVDLLDNQYECTPLSWAAWNGHPAVVQLLLEHGAQVDSVDNYQRTPISWASASGHKDVVQTLLKYGARFDEPDAKYGMTPLSWAAWLGREAVVRFLLDQGAQVDSVDRNQRTPFSWACERGYKDVVQLLVERGAQVDAMDTYQRTPLSYAADAGDEAVVRLLLDYGALIDSMDKDECTPLWWAAENHHVDVVRVLLIAGANVNTVSENAGTPLQRVAALGYDDVVRVMIDHGADVNIGEHGHGTPLWAAVTHNHESVVKMLIDAGANVNTYPVTSDALQAAISAGNDNIAQMLRAAGANEVFGTNGGDDVYGLSFIHMSP